MNQIQTKENSQCTIHPSVHCDGDLYKIGAMISAAFAGGIGLWAIICLSSAFLAEGPLSLVKGLFGALTTAM